MAQHFKLPFEILSNHQAGVKNAYALTFKSRKFLIQSVLIKKAIRGIILQASKIWKIRTVVF
jgi:hypothetical protein